MAQVINTNVLSLVTQNNLNRSQSALGNAIQRLSSGLRINSAKDDAAGQAISNRFTANVKGLTQAARNANDGISIAQTTEGALNEINNNLQRIRELTVQAKNGSNSESDIKSIQEEVTQRTAEINRISEQTQFNGVKVLSGDTALNLQIGANDKEQISVDLKKMDATTLGIDKLDLSVKTSGPHGSKASSMEITGKVSASDPYTKQNFDIDTTSLKTTLQASNETLSDVYYGVDSNGKEDKSKLVIEVKDKNGDTKFYEGTQDTSNVLKTADKTFIPGGKIELTKGTEIKSASPSINDAPLKGLDDALAQVDSLRSAMGAVQNRLESTVNNLNNTVTNLSAANSRILDADYATEVSNMSKGQILQQAGTAVLAQANQAPQNVLSLLR
ncbi:FliC/FljB family flagellin [Proteus myxofaciens]|uniref:Flagellin n=1 Tax=Proteus myxofaciens ATCC 19692 TaxID=1354337 RepID=A0A198GIY9_9GAMM|nr:FliC/FljB family flagellin [Proteus myxofaciens]OAT37068.1 FliC family flagellar biosynthesis protein [Proteus myxofaciens ATCC 19692]